MESKYISPEARKKIEKKFYGHDVLYSKYTPQIPLSAEREYIRLVNDYMKLVKEEFENSLPELKDIYKSNRDKKVRLDSDTDLILRIANIFQKMKIDMSKKTGGFKLRRRLEELSQLNRKLTVKEWKKAIKATLGIDIKEDYYNGDFYKRYLSKWVDNNVDLISSIPEGAADRMQELVYEAYDKGRTTTDLLKNIKAAFDVDKNRARLIARDQTAKLNGQIQRAQQQDAGIEEYIWSTSGDGRVRRSHAELNGRKFRWDEPPLNSDGRACHPGEDYQCRCIGRPVFKRSMNIPIKSDDIKITGG